MSEIENGAAPAADTSVAISTEVAPVTEHIVTTETPATPVVDKAKPATMEETIRAKFRELNKVSDPIRGPDGKFQKPATLAGDKIVADPATDVADPATEVVDPSVTEAAEAAKKAAEAAKVVDPALEKAPTSWKKEAQAKWQALDPEIRAEVLRREQDFHKGIEGYKSWANVGQQLDAEIRPYEAMIRASGSTPQQIIKDVFNTIYQLKTGNEDQKAAVALNILNEYGVDLKVVSAAAEKVAAGQPAVDPQVEALKNELSTVKKSIEEQSQTAMRQEFAEVIEEAQKFAKAPGHEHYELVKLEMAALIESGRADGLQDAYDKAIWTHPEVRAKLIAKQREDERKLAAEKAAKAKKAAAVNVAPRGTLPSAPKVGTMEDTLRTKYRELQNRTDV